MKTKAWIVSYDISDGKMRTRVHKLLGGFGHALQKSAFVCLLEDRRQRKLLTLLAEQPLQAGDRLDVFGISEPWCAGPGVTSPQMQPPEFVVVE